MSKPPEARGVWLVGSPAARFAGEQLVTGAEGAVAAAAGALGGVAGWLTYAALSGIVGLILGAIIAFVLHKVLGVGADKAH